MSTMRNSVMLIGRPGADPEMKNFDNKQRVDRLRLAVNETNTNALKTRNGSASPPGTVWLTA